MVGRINGQAFWSGTETQIPLRRPLSKSLSVHDAVVGAIAQGAELTSDIHRRWHDWVLGNIGLQARVLELNLAMRSCWWFEDCLADGRGEPGKDENNYFKVVWQFLLQNLQHSLRPSEGWQLEAKVNVPGEWPSEDALVEE